jgi:hypothetical protein
MRHELRYSDLFRANKLAKSGLEGMTFTEKGRSGKALMIALAESWLPP